MPPKRKPTAAAASKPTRSTRGRSTTVKEESESEDELSLTAAPKSSTKRTSSAKTPPSSRTAGRASKAKPPPPEEESEEEAEEEAAPAPEDASDDSEPAPPKRSGRLRSAPRSKPASKPKAAAKSTKKPATGRRVKAPSASEDDEIKAPVESGEESNDAPPVKKAKPASKSSKKAPPSRRAQEPSDDQDSEAPVQAEEESDSDSESPAPKRGSKAAPSKPKANGNRNRAVVESDSDSSDDAAPAAAAEVPTVEKDGPPDITVAGPSSDEEDLLPQVSLRASAAPPSRIGGRIGGSSAPPSRVGTSFSVPPPPPVEIETGPKSRLVIHKMALVNFKSYKGRQEIGPFHKSFSAIVGPNGSGKSNTIDALLFVFGYRASKMRQGKLSELIHNSVGPATTNGKKKKKSKKQQDDDDSDTSSDGGYVDQGGIDSCSVEVHFREIVDLPGPDAYKVVPNSKLVVARTAYRSNKSEYTINGRGSSFTEVTTLLKDRGIDLDHKRFLILQGEVESIAQMKPKAPSEHEDGLLEYLEDIIGTSRYKTPIEECNKEVEELNEERASKLTRLRHVEKEKSRLEEEKREVEDALRDQNALVRAQSLLAQFYIYQALKNVESYKADIDKLGAKLAHEVEKNKDDILESENLQAQYEDRAAQYDVVRKETAKLVKDLAVHEKEEVKLQEKKKHASSKQKKLKKSISDDTHAKNEADSIIETSTAQLKKRKKELDALEAELEREEAELEVIQDGLKDKTLPFQRQIETKQKELAPWTTKINSKQAEVDLAESERAMLAEKATGAQAAVDEAMAALEKLQAEKENKERELSELNRERKTLQKQIKDGSTQLSNFNENVQKLRGKVSSARQKVDEAKASQAASTSQNAVLDSLNRLRAAGRIHGFHGRLGSLGTIPDKYDVAVSTACSALNNLVVDTVEQGQSCIEYLRKQNVGRASFFVLEKLPADGRLDKIPTPENVPRLFDLIKPKDPKFAAAFYKGLGNTLVANDLDQANRIAYGQQKRWRVVTLEGQLFDTSGTMSGGGTKVAKGGMSSKLASDAVQPAVLKQYETDSDKLNQELEELLAERTTLENEVEQLQKQLPALELSAQKLELDLQNADKRIEQDERRIKELSSHTKPDAGDVKRIKALDGVIATSTAELNKLREKSSVIESDIKDLQDKILEIGGIRLRSQKAKVDGVKEQIDHVNETITKAEVGKAKAERDSEKLETALASATEALGELDMELDVLVEELAVCSEDLANVRSQVEKAQEIAESAKEDLAEMKAELDEKMVSINKFRAKEMEIKQRLQDKNKAMKEDDAKIAHWSNLHDKLELHEIDDDDDDEEEEPAKPKGEDDAEAEGSGEDARPPKDAAVKDEPSEAKVKLPKSAEKLELEVYSEDALAAVDLSELKADVATLEERVRNAKPNMGLLAEYRKRESEFLDRAKDLEQITEARDAAKNKFDGLRKSRLEEFMTGFSAISSKLKEMYQMITLGGNAELELVDSLDPFSEGIIFSVMPPKKSWKNISNLSGGEKTLSSLALVFALHVYKPTPLYFMDEIDAALDFRNVSIVANYIKDRTKNAQFIIISLRNDMFELSHRLIGIYKTSNATRSVSIDNHLLTPTAVPAVPTTA